MASAVIRDKTITAALVWMTAAIGILAGLGLWQFASIVTLIIAILLFVIRRVNVAEEFERYENIEQSGKRTLNRKR